MNTKEFKNRFVNICATAIVTFVAVQLWGDSVPAPASRFDAIASMRASVPTRAWTRSWWLPRFDAKRALAEKGDYPVVFLGDSITHNWESAGSNVWAKNFATGTYKAINFGFGGDRTENVLWRIRHGQLGNLQPKALVLLIGTNNTGHRDVADESALDTALGVKAIIEDLRARYPETTLIVHAIFPRAATTNEPMRVRNDRVNQSLLQYFGRVENDKLLFADINAKFLTPDGTLSRDIFPDLLHPNEKGYEIWAAALKPYLDYAFGLSTQRPRRANRLLYPTALDTTSPRTLCPVVKDHWIADNRRKGANVKPDLRMTEKLAEVRGNADRYYDVVMIGDSITHLFETGRGKGEWAKLKANYKILNLGFGGDGCQHTLWNVLYGGFLESFQTRVVTLMIGTNNRKASAEEVAEGIRRCVNAIREKQPGAVILLHPMIPRIDPKLAELRAKNDKTNELIKPLADGTHVVWCDLRPIFEAVSPEKQKEYLPDGTHPNGEAYGLWREAVTPHFNRILNKTNN